MMIYDATPACRFAPARSFLSAALETERETTSNEHIPFARLLQRETAIVFYCG